MRLRWQLPWRAASCREAGGPPGPTPGGAAAPPFNLFPNCVGLVGSLSLTACLSTLAILVSTLLESFKAEISNQLRVFLEALAIFPSAEASERCSCALRPDVNQRQRQRSIVCSPTWSAPDFSDDLSFLVIPSAWRISNSTALPMNVVAFWKERRAEKRARRLAKAQSDEIDRQLVEESKHRRQRHDILLISSCSHLLRFLAAVWVDLYCIRQVLLHAKQKRSPSSSI